MKLLLVLFLIAVSFQIEMKIYDKAGSYILTPEDYDYKPNIFIQLWGAGSGSSYYGTAYGGNSGAYVAANISTMNFETFHFQLGLGDICPYYISKPGVQDCKFNVIIGYDGGYSNFRLLDNSVLFNVSGGIAWYYNGTSFISENAKMISSNHRADDSIINISEGYTYPYASVSYGYGASSPFGNLGGYGMKYNETNNCNGVKGSGAGQYCNFKPTNMNVEYQKGGDGALIVYY